MRAYLIRIGVDQAYGGWNAPMDPRTREFVWVPIPETRPMRVELKRTYAEIVPALKSFEQSHTDARPGLVRLPYALQSQQIHLDPDFSHLTYGDSGTRRGKGLTELGKDDVLVFYAGLKPVAQSEHQLVYALVGLYRIAEVVRAGSVPSTRWAENAHTRCIETEPADVIVRGESGHSGRLRRCIPMGEFREKAYRVQNPILDAWGGLSCKNGYLQRSAVLPTFLEPAKFMRWFDAQQPELIAANNV